MATSVAPLKRLPVPAGWQHRLGGCPDRFIEGGAMPGEAQTTFPWTITAPSFGGPTPKPTPFVTGATGIGVVLTIGFAVMAGSMVLFAWLAAQNDWQSEGSSDDGRGQVVSPQMAWTNTRARARILWVLFGFAFLSALVLLVGRSFAGVAMILVAFVLAIIAMRMD